jgi:anti-sigma-K factor RskA
MNGNKLKQLFAAARNESAPAPSAEFAAEVMRAAHRQPQPEPAASCSVWEHLNGWFPRVALAAAAVIVLCLAADWGLTTAGLPGISDGAAQVSSQYLFAPENL